MTKAIVLLSGGIDSTVVLALALEQKRSCYALSFDYGQRHRVELQRAQKIAAYYQVPHHIIKMDPQALKNSSLVSLDQMPTHRSKKQMSEEGIPNTYVPARNTLFLAYALSQCEQLNAQEIHFGPHRADASCYPDCRPAYLNAFQQLMQLATKQTTEGEFIRLVTPLLAWDKTEIIAQGLRLNAPLEWTISCYQPTQNEQPCQCCDACLLRAEGFLMNKR